MSNEWPQNQWRETRPLGPPTVAPPPPSRWGPILAIGALVLVIAVVAGVVVWTLVGDDGDAAGASTTPAPKPDLSTLDVGDYDVQPREFAGPLTEEDARYLESMRLAQAVAFPPDIFPTMTYVNGLPLADGAMFATLLSGTGTPIMLPAFEKYGRITGFLLNGYTVPQEEFARTASGPGLFVGLSSFPGRDQAFRAAREMDALDSAVNPDNVAVPIPGYPDANAHYRPGFTSIAVSMASGQSVISVLYSDPAGTTAESLAAQVRRILDVQVPLIEGFAPAPEVALTMAEIDPDHMFSRVLTDEDPQIGPKIVRYSAPASRLCANSGAIRDDFFGETGVDRCANSPGSLVLRTRDDGAAKTLVSKFAAQPAGDDVVETPLEAPEGVPDAVCFKHTPKDPAGGEPSFGCLVTYGRYTASVSGESEVDIRQRAAAQYALLVNNE